ncbi:hypothetical protein SMICM304S_00785 [Streptomyces microflavus]
MAKYAAGEACVKAVDQAVHTLGGNGLTREYGLGRPDHRVPRRPDRPGQPGDDPQLRLPPVPGPSEVVLEPAAGGEPEPSDLSPFSIPRGDSPTLHTRTAPRAASRAAPASATTGVLPWCSAASTQTSRPSTCPSTKRSSAGPPPSAYHGALIDGTDGTSLTYAQLDRFHRRIAAALADAG